jgi:hypothetical protein
LDQLGRAATLICALEELRRRYHTAGKLTKKNFARAVVYCEKPSCSIENPGFASHLARQWLGLIDAGIAGEFQV